MLVPGLVLDQTGTLTLPCLWLTSFQCLRVTSLPMTTQGIDTDSETNCTKSGGRIRAKRKGFYLDFIASIGLGK